MRDYQSTMGQRIDISFKDAKILNLVYCKNIKIISILIKWNLKFIENNTVSSIYLTHYYCSNTCMIIDKIYLDPR